MRGLSCIFKKRGTTVKEEDFLAFIKEKENYKIMNTPKTIKLYDVTPYETTFTANVLSCEECEQHNTDAGQTLSSAAQPQYKTYKLILDQTLFFPEEGGQTPDKGTINGMEVIDVQINNDIIEHYMVLPDQITSSSPLPPNTPITGTIDWAHRFSNMQQHSAEHIFSGTVHIEYGLNNVGFHLSDNIVTMDFDGVLTAEQIENIEWKVNQAIAENIEIDARYPSKEELAELTYRSKIEIDGPVRIVTIPGYDVCACCAPHVRRTGEIGMLKVMTIQNYKGGVRVSILCGFRALQAFGEKNKVVSQLTGLLSTNQENIIERVSQLKEQNQELKLQIGILKQEAMLGKIEKIPSEQENVILIEEELDTAIVRNVVNALVEKHAGICGMFVGNDTEGYRFIIGSKNADCRETAAGLREAFGAKGGGSAAMIQGSLGGSKEEIFSFFK